MKLKALNFWTWLKSHPTALINMVGIAIIIFGIFGVVVYKSTQSIDVLSEWDIAISTPGEKRTIDGKEYAVYNPGDSMIFTSTSTKIRNAEGTTTRMIICDATSKFKEREIQLDTLVAGRPIGKNPSRENAIIIPDVTQFQGLPRYCRLVIDIIYKDVEGTNRDWNEHAETEKFIVEETALTTKQLLEKIQNLEKQIIDLRSQLPANDGEVSSADAAGTPLATPAPARSEASSTTGSAAPQENTTVANAASADDRSDLARLPVVGGLFDALGL